MKPILLILSTAATATAQPPAEYASYSSYWSYWSSYHSSHYPWRHPHDTGVFTVEGTAYTVDASHHPTITVGGHTFTAWGHLPPSTPFTVAAAVQTKEKEPDALSSILSTMLPADMPADEPRSTTMALTQRVIVPTPEQ
ncbi:hypothetical protein DL764_008284 [Monosporascus ibericus]|uniref:Uncharacterized protein n=1 Tax=Monosporascus ibericus TaxID=155417 RepID=A0A4Q4T048_9PEZI|nr:hypothetical protein DL764_008284 [Monosporascus ibericus]